MKNLKKPEIPKDFLENQTNKFRLIFEKKKKLKNEEKE